MIGVFDSGVGGLTVLRTLLSRFPKQEFVYLGDTARLPYGTKSPETIRGYVALNISTLRKLGATRIVVACNSASSVLEPGSQSTELPIHNVIDPGVQSALNASRTGKIGIVGTRATVTGNAYLSRIKAARPDAQVIQQACPLWVPFVEEGLENDPKIDAFLRQDLEPFRKAGVDTLVLGCTHYPVLAPKIREILGPSVQLVDSADALANSLADSLESETTAHSEPSPTAPTGLRVFCTDGGEHFSRIASRLLGRSLQVERAP